MNRLPAKLTLGRLSGARVKESSVPAAAACVADAADYFRRTEGMRPASAVAAELVADVLADRTRTLYLLHCDGEPSGLLELAFDTPEPDDVTVVLFVLAARVRRQGLGHEAAAALFDRFAECGVRRVRLGVARNGREAAAFWSSLGMWECGRDEGVRLFELPLGRPHYSRAG